MAPRWLGIALVAMLAGGLAWWTLRGSGPRSVPVDVPRTQAGSPAGVQGPTSPRAVGLDPAPEPPAAAPAPAAPLVPTVDEEPLVQRTATPTIPYLPAVEFEVFTDAVLDTIESTGVRPRETWCDDGQFCAATWHLDELSAEDFDDVLRQIEGDGGERLFGNRYVDPEGDPPFVTLSVRLDERGAGRFIDAMRVSGIEITDVPDESRYHIGIQHWRRTREGAF